MGTIVELQLDEEGVPFAQLVRDLDAAAHFSADVFPGNKLLIIARAILSGKIVHDQMRTIDGPRPGVA